MGNYNECIAEADKIISIFKDNTALLQNDSYFKDFVLAIYYAAIYRAFLKEIDESNQMINLLDSIADAKSREPSLFYEIKILYKLGAGMASLDIKMLRNTIAEFKQLPEEITANFDPVKRIEIFHIAANASIIDEKPKETLEYINCIRTVKPKYLRPDIRYYARILFLVAHFDLENFDAIETGVRAARTSYKRKMIQNPFYSAVLHMFSKIVRAQSLREKEDAIREFLAGYEGESAAIWAKMNNFFNIRAWLNSKLENRKFTDVLRQSYQL
ncbi:MAG TPA: hypothetical protein ENJ82_12270 [Bacteroidetes bacterium]|nr:hypothetical protein [Bacteroidota bacterium]